MEYGIKESVYIKSTWQYIRKKSDVSSTYNCIWIKGLPFKTCFFMWRLWKCRIPVDENTRRWGLQGPSKYWCYDKPAAETLAYVFRKSFYANRTWSCFSSFASILILDLTLRGSIFKWWKGEVKRREQPYFHALCNIILWELWRRRNKKKHNKKNITGLRLIYNLTRNMRLLLKDRKPTVDFPSERPGILKKFANLKSKMKVTKVLWELLVDGCVKYNTDGGKEGGGSYAFCLRDRKSHSIC